MTAQVARLALPFTDGDLATGDVRIENTTTLTLFTITLALPSVDGVSDGYYNGGDLGDGTFGSYATPNESLVMAFVNQIGSAGILENFPITVTEDPLLPGRYVMTRTDAGAWKILWDDVLTTMPSQWLGFDEVTYTSTTSVITAPWQADRLWRATRPTWNRQREHKKTSHAMTWSGGTSTRQLSDIRIEWQLKYSAQVGARIYKYDGTQQPLVDVVPGMALGDPNLALESLWQWIAARTPVEYWADEDDLTTSEYLRPREASMLDAVIRNINAERSSAPPVYDIVMEFITSSAGAVGTGGGGVICPPATVTPADPPQYATYALLPAITTEGEWAEVTTTGAAGAYRGMIALSGTTVNTWLRSDHYRRVLNGAGWVVNGSADHFAWLTSNAGGTSTAAALPAGGWTNGSSGSGTLTDVGGNTQIDHPTASGIALLNFNTTWPTGQVLFVLKTSATLGTSPFAGMFDVEQTTPSALHRVSVAAGSVLNDVEFVNGAGTPLAGSKGDFSLPAFDTMFGVYQTGTIGADDTALNQVWGSDKGFVAAEGSQVPSTTTTAGGAAVRGRLFSLNSGGAARLLVQQFMAFQLGQ